jgi:hypothetical protein
MAKPKTVAKEVALFIGSDPFNAMFVHEAINRYAEFVMRLNPKEHERSIVSLNLMQEIAQEWYDITQNN